MRVICVAGARPNYMKVKPVMDALEESAAEVILVHTGQHYDSAMNDVFFADLGIRPPDHRLQVGGRRQVLVAVDADDAFLVYELSAPIALGIDCSATTDNVVGRTREKGSRSASEICHTGEFHVWNSLIREILTQCGIDEILHYVLWGVIDARTLSSRYPRDILFWVIYKAHLCWWVGYANEKSRQIFLVRSAQNVGIDPCEVVSNSRDRDVTWDI